MIEITDDKVIFSKETWEDLKADDYYKQIIEAIEDREDLLNGIQDTEYIGNFKQFDRKRTQK